MTHQALFRPEDNERLLNVRTPLRHSLSTLLNFFAATYKAVFGFDDGPPVHDPLCIAYVARPGLFEGKRYRVDVELEGKWTAGTTSVDLYEYRTPDLASWKQDPESRESWGALGKNVFVLEQLDVRRRRHSADQIFQAKTHVLSFFLFLFFPGPRFLGTLPRVC